MEGEREEQGESTLSGTTPTQIETPIQNSGQASDEPLNLQKPPEEEKEEKKEEEVKEEEEEKKEEEEKDHQADSGACDGEVEPTQAVEDLCISDAETLPLETLIATNTQDDADCLPLSPLPTEEELTPPSVSFHTSHTQNRPSGPCWYCLRSLDSEYRPETPKQEDSDPSTPLPSSGQKMSYQTDPRPHFGVAWSSHSTCRPLWGSEGPCWGQRNQEVPDQTHTCPHCHLGLPPDTLRWHEAKCLLFEGLRNSKK